MGNKDWDNYLRDLLGDFKTEGETPHWDEFSQQLDPESTQPETEEFLQDQLLKEKLDNYTPSGTPEGWDRIEHSLNAADKAFDEEVRHRVKQYQAPTNPESWTVFMNHFSNHKLLRFKLIALKVVETAAIVLILFTVLQLGQVGKLPFISQATEPMADSGEETLIKTNNTLQHPTDDATSSEIIAPPTSDVTSIRTEINSNPSNTSNSLLAKASRPDSQLPTHNADVETRMILAENTDQSTSEELDIIVAPMEAIPSEALIEFNDDLQSVSASRIEASSPMDADFIQPREETYVTSSIMPRNIIVKNSKVNTIPDPVFVKVAAENYLEFGMLAQADYNQLKMPEDKLYNDGKQIVFPLQGITSPGYGAGFTLAFGHPRWAFETGLIYSSKTFKPGRELTIGSLSDNSNVDFEAMRMQLVSVPLQYRYRFDHTGRLKVYGMAGFGFHYIAQSDVDVMVEHNFNSLQEGVDPSSVPSLARTIRQAQRVSDDLRDTAPFSTKSYISANLGAGIEYTIAERKTLFLQSSYQYQIPNLRFSNHNGKHLLSISFQAGVRTPLGS